MAYRLIATDLDGTLLPSAWHVPTHTRAVIERVRALGVPIVAVTARGPWSTKPVADAFGLGGVAVCTSGSVLYDLDAERILEERMLAPGPATRAVLTIRGAWPGTIFACSRHGTFDHEPAYQPAIEPPAGSVVADALELATRPMNKLLAVHPQLHADDWIEHVIERLGDGYKIVASGGRWVEVLSPRAGKAELLADLCAARGIAPEEVVAFGDLPIDLPMLTWAGLGVAPGNAHPAVRAAADMVTGTNDDEGVARVLEGLLEEDALLPSDTGTPRR